MCEPRADPATPGRSRRAPGSFWTTLTSHARPLEPVGWKMNETVNLHGLKVNAKGSHGRRWHPPPGSGSQTRDAVVVGAPQPCKSSTSHPFRWLCGPFPSLAGPPGTSFLSCLRAEAWPGASCFSPRTSVFPSACWVHATKRSVGALLAWTLPGGVSPFSCQAFLPPTPAVLPTRDTLSCPPTCSLFFKSLQVAGMSSPFTPS